MKFLFISDSVVSLKLANWWNDQLVHWNYNQSSTERTKLNFSKSKSESSRSCEWIGNWDWKFDVRMVVENVV